MSFPVSRVFTLYRYILYCDLQVRGDPRSPLFPVKGVVDPRDL